MHNYMPKQFEIHLSLNVNLTKTHDILVEKRSYYNLYSKLSGLVNYLPQQFHFKVLGIVFSSGHGHSTSASVSEDQGLWSDRGCHPYYIILFRRIVYILFLAFPF